MDTLKKTVAAHVASIVTNDMHLVADELSASYIIADHGETEAVEVQAVSPLVTQVKIKFKNRAPRYFVVKVSETL